MDDFKAKVAEIKARHGDVYVLTFEDARVVVRPPSIADYDMLKAEIEKEKGSKPVTAIEKLFRKCVLYPELGSPELEAMLARRPGLSATFGRRCAELAGLGESCDMEKA